MSLAATRYSLHATAYTCATHPMEATARPLLLKGMARRSELLEEKAGWPLVEALCDDEGLPPLLLLLLLLLPPALLLLLAMAVAWLPAGAIPAGAGPTSGRGREAGVCVSEGARGQGAEVGSCASYKRDRMHPTAIGTTASSCDCIGMARCRARHVHCVPYSVMLTQLGTKQATLLAWSQCLLPHTQCLVRECCHQARKV